MDENIYHKPLSMLMIEEFLYLFAEFSASILELIGILIIIIGSIRALVRLLRCVVQKKTVHAIIDLGKVFLLALEFKMGGEVLRTVVVREWEELGILGAIIILRGALTFLIHWEIQKEEQAMEKQELKNAINDQVQKRLAESDTSN